MRLKKADLKFQTQLIFQEKPVDNAIEIAKTIATAKDYPVSFEIPTRKLTSSLFLPIFKKECKKCGSSFATHFEPVDFCANCLTNFIDV